LKGNITVPWVTTNRITGLSLISVLSSHQEPCFRLEATTKVRSAVEGMWTKYGSLH